METRLIGGWHQGLNSSILTQQDQGVISFKKGKKPVSEEEGWMVTIHDGHYSDNPCLISYFFDVKNDTEYYDPTNGDPIYRRIYNHSRWDVYSDCVYGKR
mmetsp:Transcript_16760/g.14657  ORF Transcript_16760/g.14657 Transcript_16760/m.14657 type:complete len:100 (+) Transcript_16760:96-395(+)